MPNRASSPKTHDRHA